jgi:hypothetical protein
VHSYYHLVLLVLSYCYVGYLSDWIDHSLYSYDIFISSTEEMEKYESLPQREFGHTCVYDVNLLERVGMDEELPLILQTIGWGKLYGAVRMTRVTDG